MDQAAWTLLFAILAVAVPIAFYVLARYRRAAVTVLDEGKILRVLIRNTGEADIVLASSAYTVLETTSYFQRQNVVLKPKAHVQLMVNGFAAATLPVRLQSEDEAYSIIPRPHFADDLWMANCIDRCWVRFGYRATDGRQLLSAPYQIPVDSWLPVDASARTLNPRS